ncbi:hypothetical protein [Natrarchaeobaculum sulfurireducens]|uniref:Uncharacterized protein n=1 Tax=Natrarchaeobaculum sulfurireducens TaxID=2044521 RepID=A0A346PSB6_9EURY|nr:hypothetical protein [Natrarchaeobaculum sulfurireducens]AXR82411.1 hypothetical protein AArcMg_2419 [Natrarchaeobaculum sulfurireducens]
MDPGLRPGKHHQRRTSDRLERLEERLEATDRRVRLLQNTLCGVARNADISIGCACTRCERSYLLITSGMLVCPQCGYRQSM